MIGYLADDTSQEVEEACLTSLCEFPPPPPRELVYVRDEDGEGVAKTRNKAWHKAKGDFIISMDNDVVLQSKGWVGLLTRELRKDASIGLIAPCSDNWCFTPGQKRDEPSDDLLFESEHHLSGWFWAFRRELLEKVGYLDEQFSPFYFEDTDYCRRVQAAGYRLMIHPGVVVHHIGGGSGFEKQNPHRKRIWEENLARYKAKWGDV